MNPTTERRRQGLVEGGAQAAPRARSKVVTPGAGDPLALKRWGRLRDEGGSPSCSQIDWGQRVSVGVGENSGPGWGWDWGLGGPPPGLSLYLPSPQSTGATLQGGGARGVEGRGTASNCYDLKSKEEELGTSQKSSPQTHGSPQPLGLWEDLSRAVGTAKLGSSPPSS